MGAPMTSPARDKQFARICAWLKAHKGKLRSFNTHKSAKAKVWLLLEPKP